MLLYYEEPEKETKQVEKNIFINVSQYFLEITLHDKQDINAVQGKPTCHKSWFAPIIIWSCWPEVES